MSFVSALVDRIKNKKNAIELASINKILKCKYYQSEIMADNLKDFYESLVRKSNYSKIDRIFGVDRKMLAIKDYIRYFTLRDDVKEGWKHLFEDKKYLSLACEGYVEAFENPEDGKLVVKTKDGEIDVWQYSDLGKNFLPKQVIDDLTSLERYGKCHGESIGYVLGSSGDVFDCKVVTSWLYGSHPWDKYLHSWVEMVSTESKEEFCFDYTLNGMLRKEDYYKIHHVDKDKVSIKTKEELERDYDKIQDMYHINYEVKLWIRKF